MTPNGVCERGRGAGTYLIRAVNKGWKLGLQLLKGLLQRGMQFILKCASVSEQIFTGWIEAGQSVG